METFYPSTVWTTSQPSTCLLRRVTKLTWSWYQEHNQCSAKSEKYLYLFKTRSRRSWNKWSDKASLNQYSQEESLMHLLWCGRERSVENWDFAWTWKCTSMARSWMRTTQYQTWRRSSTTYMGLHTLAKLTSLSEVYYQIELDEEAKDICTINTSQGLFKMCRLPQGLKNSSSI